MALIPHYFYGDFLLKEKKTDDAKTYPEKAFKAPARSGREIADNGHRRDITNDLAAIK